MTACHCDYEPTRVYRARAPTSEQHTDWSAPMWQAYVARGKTREQRVSRLEQAPEAWQARVRAHVQTYYGILRARR